MAVRPVPTPSLCRRPTQPAIPHCLPATQRRPTRVWGAQPAPLRCAAVWGPGPHLHRLARPHALAPYQQVHLQQRKQRGAGSSSRSSSSGVLAVKAKHHTTPHHTTHYTTHGSSLWRMTHRGYAYPLPPETIPRGRSRCCCCATREAGCAGQALGPSRKQVAKSVSMSVAQAAIAEYPWVAAVHCPLVHHLRRYSSAHAHVYI